MCVRFVAKLGVSCTGQSMQVHAVASSFLGCSTVASGMSLSRGMARHVRRRGRAGVVEIMTTIVLYVESSV
jgi:hypothetical protein